MSASWLNFVSSFHQGAPMRSVRCSHRAVLPEQSVLNDGICLKLHLSSLTVLEFQLSQFIPAFHGSTPLVIGAGSWSDTMADLGAVAERHPRALSPSVCVPGIYSWCG